MKRTSRASTPVLLVVVLAVSGCSAAASGENSEGPPGTNCYGIALPDSLRGNFAADRNWFAPDPGIPVLGQTYWRFGVVRAAEVLARSDAAASLVLAGSYDGVPVYAEGQDLPRPQVIYLAVSPDCRFSAYATADAMRSGPGGGRPGD